MTRISIFYLRPNTVVPVTRRECLFYYGYNAVPIQLKTIASPLFYPSSLVSSTCTQNTYAISVETMSAIYGYLKGMKHCKWLQRDVRGRVTNKQNLQMVTCHWIQRPACWDFDATPCCSYNCSFEFIKQADSWSQIHHQS